MAFADRCQSIVGRHTSAPGVALLHEVEVLLRTAPPGLSPRATAILRDLVATIVSRTLPPAPSPSLTALICEWQNGSDSRPLHEIVASIAAAVPGR